MGKKLDEQIAGLIIGRFQPFHLGHLETVLRIVAERGYAKIAVGSAQYSDTSNNPFTYEERERMIRAALHGEVPESAYQIYRVPDIHNYPKWVEHVESIVGGFSAIYTTNPVNERLFREAGHDVALHKMRKGVSGSAVRQLIAAGDDAWQKMLPDAVAQIIREIDGISRIQVLCSETPE